MNSLDRRRFLYSCAGLFLASALPVSAAERTYTVRKGDNLTKIANRYSTTVAAIKRRNALKSDMIYVNQKLIIPDSTSAISSTIRSSNRIRINRSKWKYIVAHHSATSVGSATSFDKVDRRHGMENGLAYHFVIGNGNGAGDGEIQIGPRWTKQLHGGHVSKWEYNNHGIGICLVGNFEKTRPTTKQINSFIQLTEYLGNDVLRGKYQFKVHKEINATLCPGRYFPTKEMHRRFS